ncbi:MAG: DnaJ domain-containing protein [Desulfobacteraceae bacterium]|nr:DnaJ domain-containing protein [Desulfobacteraceae bacterium]
MDRKTALEILILEDGVCLEEAKKAYRSLAKKYHPDVVGKNALPQKNAEVKMKEINLAFRYIAPKLKSRKTIKKENIKEEKTTKGKSTKSQKDTLFSFFYKMSETFVSDFIKAKPQKDAKKILKKDKPVKTRKARQNRNIRFDDVFKNVHKDGVKKKTTIHKKKQDPLKRDPFERYQKYMALKRKMKSRRSSRHQEVEIGRVEKIEPVTPVNPVGKD